VAAGKSVHLLYFAAFHDAAGRREETFLSAASTAAELYDEVAARYGFRFDRSILGVALNDEVVPWHSELSDGDLVAFLAPFAGG
jgi:molybdopterin converting factor small subunit